jgi:hypothetical protein
MNWEKHSQLNHSMTQHSPDGINKIYECSDCGCSFFYHTTGGGEMKVRYSFLPVLTNVNIERLISSKQQ